jgi:hypothetical protein
MINPLDKDEYMLFMIDNIVKTPMWRFQVYQRKDMTLMSSMEMAYEHSPTLFMYFISLGVPDAVIDTLVSGVCMRGVKWSGGSGGINRIVA